MMKKYFLAMLLVFQFCFVQIACSADDERALDINYLWLSKTTGTWNLGDSSGYYRVLVTRKPGEAHSYDDVFIQIYAVYKDEAKILRTINLDAPGYQGYVKDVFLVSIDDLNMVAVHIDIEMKAMDGIVMREIYLVSPDGIVKPVVQAKYMDIYDD